MIVRLVLAYDADMDIWTQGIPWGSAMQLVAKRGHGDVVSITASKQLYYSTSQVLKC